MNPLQSDAAKQLGIDNLPQEMQDQILAQLGENILKRIIIEVMEKIPEESRGAFEEAGKAANEEKLKELFRSYIPNYDDFVKQIAAEEIAEFKKLVTQAQ